MPVEILGSGEDPFKPTPDPRYLYFNAERQKTYDSLVADIRGGRPSMLLVGGSGMGKTTLLWKLQQDLGAADFQVIFPSYTRLSYEELLESCRELGAQGLGAEESKEEGADAGQEDGKPTLILIDEAQVVADGALEQFCQLCEQEKAPPVQVLFAGQPQLVDRLSASDVEAARSCAEARYVLDRLDDLDTTAYIHHRLSVAGAEAPAVFESRATDRVARLAGGVPRLINRLSGTSLRMAQDQDAETVSPDIVDLAAAICDPAPDIDGAMALFGDTDEEAADEGAAPEVSVSALAEPEAESERERSFAEASKILSLANPVYVPSGLDPEKGKARAATAEEVAEQESGLVTNLVELPPDVAAAANQAAASDRAAASARKASSWRPIKLGGFVIGVLIGAAVMVGLLLLTGSPEESILARFQLSEPAPAERLAQEEPAKSPPIVPSIVALAASGPEDRPLGLEIAVSVPGGEDQTTVTVEIAGLPEGGRLSAGTLQGDGTWRLNTAELADLQYIPVANYSGRFALSVSATVREKGVAESGANLAFANTSLPVAVLAVADEPRLAVANAGGRAQEAIPLSIETDLRDLDGSEGLEIQVIGLPVGYQLSAGVRGDDGIWLLSPENLGGLTVTPPLTAGGSIPLEVRAVAREADGDETVALANPTLSVEANIRKPVLTLASAEGREDTTIPLRIGVATEDVRGVEGLTIDVLGLPPGARLSAGRTDDAGVWRLTAAELEGLSLSPPAHYSGKMALTVAAGVPEFAESEVTAELAVSVVPVPDEPIIAVNAARGPEDQPLPLSITARLADTDGSEDLSLRLAGLPEGLSLSAGSEAQGNGWLLTPEQLEGLSLIPAPNLSLSFDLLVTGRSREAGGEEAVLTARLPVTLDPVADEPTLAVAPLSGAEDSPLPLGIKAALADNDGSESLDVALAGLPDGARISVGEPGTDPGTWKLGAQDLGGAALIPPENLAGSFTLSVKADATETNGDRASVEASIPVSLAPVADPPSLVLAAAEGAEDEPLPLSIQASLSDLDGSEQLTVALAGVPEGFRLSAGRQSESGGTWALTPDQLEALTLIGPDHFSGTFLLKVAALSKERAGGTPAETIRDLPVRIAPRPDTPTLKVSNKEASEDEAVALGIEAALIDQDGSETLSLEVAGLPGGASLSAGRAENSVWRIDGSEISGLDLLPPANFSGEIPFSVKAIATEAGGETAVREGKMTVSIEGVADELSVTTADARGPTKGSLALSIAATSEDTDGSETVTIELAGLPKGAKLNKGRARSRGRWELTAEELAGLTLLPGAETIAGRYPIAITVRAEEADGDRTSSSATLVLELLALKDTIALDLGDAVGKEDEAVPLRIGIRRKEGETAAPAPVYITGLVEGAALTAGVEEAAGRWRLEETQLAGLELLPPSDFSGAMTLTVTAGSDDQALNERPSAALAVTVAPVADTPELSVKDATGPAGSPLPLQIGAAPSDLDGSESLTVEISDLPPGTRLNAGVSDGTGVWRLESEDLAGLELVSTEKLRGRFEVSVAAFAVEGEGPASEARARMFVEIAAPPAPAAAVTVPSEQSAPQAPAAVETPAEPAPVIETETEAVTAKLEPAPAAAPAALSPAESKADNEWIERGNRLLSLGDIAAARLFYELAVQQGSAKAATAMGRTYDPSFLAEQDVIGIPGNPALAAQWYQRAIDGGDTEAKRLKDALPN